MNPLFDIKSRLAMGYCWVIASRLDVGFSAPILFFSSMRILDPEHMIISEQQRATALAAMATYLRDNPESTFEPLLQRIIDDKFANAKVITLFDLLEGAALESPAPIDLALSAAGLSLSGVLQKIRQLSLERLSDQDPSEKTPDVPKYAVVIEGPGFHDETNRFPTLIQAQIVAEDIEVMRKMDPIPNSVELNGLESPAQLLEATRIYITELAGP